jgi:predicted house-cleaning noncanonical NTP pyrophosphatase (MazG superfamily)
VAIIRVQKARVNDSVGKSFRTVIEPRDFLKRNQKQDGAPEELPPPNRPEDNWCAFEQACADFIDVTHGLDDFAGLLGAVSKFFPLAFIDREIEGLLASDGKMVRTRPFLDYYEVDNATLAKIGRKFRHLEKMQSVGQKLPEWLLIGLVSQYDFFISRLLAAIYEKCPEILNDSSKQISFSELSRFNSVETAKNYMMNREIENFLRDSHQEQIRRLEVILSIPLTKNLEIWPSFVEIFERRNLLTHTDGAVSEQYLKICAGVGVDCSGLVIGERLAVSRTYLLTSARIMREFAVKLTQVAWRKLSGKNFGADSDNFLLRHVYSTILEERYKEAEELCEFSKSVLKTFSSVSIQLMMIVNHANALALQGKAEAAENKLQEHDWSANEPKYRLSVAAVRKDISSVCRLMRQIGKDGEVKASEYQEWPVFKNVNKLPEFRSTFKDIFGSEFPDSKHLPNTDGRVPKEVN